MANFIEATPNENLHFKSYFHSWEHRFGLLKQRVWEMKERFVIESIKLTNWAVKCRACDERLNQEFEEK